jgi:hypothetical protein
MSPVDDMVSKDNVVAFFVVGEDGLILLHIIVVWVYYRS